MSGNVMEALSLKGKVAIVTGSCQGLGLGMSSALAEAGADIVVTSRDQAKAVQEAQRLEEAHGVDALGLGMDLCDAESIRAMAQAAFGFKGQIDILVNNAYYFGASAPGDFLQREYQVFEQLIKANLTGTMECCRAVGKYMAERKSGKIINISSISGMVGRGKQLYRDNDMRETPVDYGVIKGGIIMLSQDLAAYFGAHGICVNTISPGGYQNPRLTPGFTEGFSKLTALGRLGDPTFDLKGAVVLLASGAANYITGQNLAVDGGFTSYK